METNKELYEKCVAFHGHSCPGLTIGYRAALYAMELLDIENPEDEDVVCISENDACGVDGIQVLLGCSVGKGNLLFHMTGKQAFSVYNRKTGSSVRLVLNPKPGNMSREESFNYYQTCEANKMFQVKETKLEVPERARIFNTVTCSCCKEPVAESMVKVENGEFLCLDCYKAYDRFKV
ncbi:MAG: FmdE family protein [Lachnospiraceae bacterium]|nr:FmdE family protein [Lachnospiraceae bacterium]